jgi:hypothetical protein
MKPSREVHGHGLGNLVQTSVGDFEFFLWVKESYAAGTRSGGKLCTVLHMVSGLYSLRLCEGGRGWYGI